MFGYHEHEVAGGVSKDKSIQIMAKLLQELDPNKWLLKSLDKKQEFLVFIDDEVVYEEDISRELVEGNIVMINAREEDKETYRVLEILANDRDAVMKLDPRETISSYLGVFPHRLLDDEEVTAHVAKESIVAIALEGSKNNRWTYETEDEGLRLLSHHVEVNGEQVMEYWGFVANHEDQGELYFVLMDEGDHIQKEKNYTVIINEE